MASTRAYKLKKTEEAQVPYVGHKQIKAWWYKMWCGRKGQVYSTKVLPLEHVTYCF